MRSTCRRRAERPALRVRNGQIPHVAFDNGAMDGFVLGSGGVAMGYWTQDDLPFTYSLASSFPFADRWFCSVLGQTDPNRRFAIAGTSGGMTDDVNVPNQSALLSQKVNGTIFQRLTTYGIDWANYAFSFPLVRRRSSTRRTTRPWSRGPTDDRSTSSLLMRRPVRCPSFSFLDEDFDTQSQDNPQNIVVGEAMLAQVVQALANGPGWADPCSLSPMTSTVVTTTMCLRPLLWRQTPSPLSWWPARAHTTALSATVSGCPG